MKKACFGLEDDVRTELKTRHEKHGTSQTWMINSALKEYLGLAGDRIYLDLSPEVLAALRTKCIEFQMTMNVAANEYIKKGLSDAGDK